ncbi:MAG: aromatic amino acid lyase, partial [Proteobacteria bacterium]|nr:aromatic amino acid lyase [Pseudomonadota bacterium]
MLSGRARVALTSGEYERVDKAAAVVARIADSGETVYGINTGFGSLARTSIDKADLEVLQEKILLSHAAGVGEPLSDPVVRLAMVLKILGLARGYSGVRRQVIDHLAALVAGDVCPVVPSKGSVGASGDLAPLAHMAGVLIGVGEARITCSQHPGRKVVPAAEALASIGL